MPLARHRLTAKPRVARAPRRLAPRALPTLLLLLGAVLTVASVGHRVTASDGPQCGAAAVVLAYHEVSVSPTDNAFEIDVATFGLQMDVLAAAGTTLLTVPQLLADLAQGCLPPRAVAITFDDGYRGAYANALPILQQRGIPATLFLIGYDATVLAPREDTGAKGVRHLGWTEIAGLAGAGWAIESHTYNLHGPHAEMLLAASPTELERDLAQEDALIATEVDQTPVAFAYPGGHAPDWAVPVLRARYEGAFIGGDRPLSGTDDRMHLPRYTVTAATDMAALLRGAFPSRV